MTVVLWLGGHHSHEELYGRVTAFIRKVENAVEESWSLSAAAFLLIGQLRGFLKQVWYFLQAEVTTWLRTPLPVVLCNGVFLVGSCPSLPCQPTSTGPYCQMC